MKLYPLRERKSSDKHTIIGRFLKPECFPAEDDPNKGRFWAAQMRFCSRLVEAYGTEFLLWVPVPFQVDSLIGYSGQWGKKYFAEQLFQFKKNVETTKMPEKTEAPTGEKVGDDLVVEEKKPKTLGEFLNLFN